MIFSMIYLYIGGIVNMKKLYELMNTQVADLNVLFVKLHHHHWFVKGMHFFNLHELFEELYNEVNELYDEFAERLIIIGGRPSSTLKDYLKLTRLTEASEVEPTEMIKAIIHDFKILNQGFKEIMAEAAKHDDEVTIDLCITSQASFDKHIWMFGE